MSIRFWLTIITLALLALVVFLGWDQIVQAWGLLGQVNLWILSLMIPIQFFSYYAVGETIFYYLRSKGDLDGMSRLNMTRMSLETNFVNHIAPVPGAAGFSYLGWVLHRNGVSASRSTMAQIIRHILAFLSFFILLTVSIIVMAFDYKIDKTIIVASSAFVLITIIGVGLLVYIISNQKKLMKLSVWSVKIINKIIRLFFRRKKKNLLDQQKADTFFTELHLDYIEIIKDKKVLIRPFWWSILSVALDAVLVLIAFWALGASVNPFALFIAFGFSSIATVVFSVLPGGAGVYETIMVTFLASTGVPLDVAIAGTLLARAVMLVGAIGLGYVYYQLTVNKYGKITKSTDI